MPRKHKKSTSVKCSATGQIQKWMGSEWVLTLAKNSVNQPVWAEKPKARIKINNLPRKLGSTRLTDKGLKSKRFPGGIKKRQCYAFSSPKPVLWVRTISALEANCWWLIEDFSSVLKVRCHIHELWAQRGEIKMCVKGQKYHTSVLEMDYCPAEFLTGKATFTPLN